MAESKVPRRPGSYRAVAPSLARQRRPLLLGLAAVVATNVFTLATPWLMKRAVDDLQARLSPRALAWYAALIVGAALLQGLFRYWSRLLIIGVSREVEYDLRNLVFERLVAHAPPFFQRHRTGDLMSRATSDVEAVRMALGPGIMQLGNTAVTFAIAIAMMLSLDPGLTLWSLLPMPLIAVVMYLSAQTYHRRFLAVQVRQAALNAVAQEDFSGIRVVKTHALEPRRHAAFAAASRDYLAANMRLARSLGFFHPLVALIAGSGTLLVLWAGGRRIVAGEATLGTLVAFMALFALLTWPTIALGWVVSLFQRGVAAMGRIEEILEAPADVPEPEAPLRPPARTGGAAVELRELTFTYPGRSEPALRGVSLRVDPGERVALVGRTGSGKSTLLALLPRLWAAPEGTVFVDGVDVARQGADGLRARIGFVPQETFLFSDSLERNVALPEDGLDEAARAAVAAACRTAQLEPDLAALPGGYAAVVGERGITLSGGQRQRVAIARALVREPALLVLDDALSAVDTETEERIVEGLFGPGRGRTLLLVSHRLSTILRADRILVLDGGRLVESGTHERLMALGGVYRGLVERQLLADELEREGR